MEVFSNDCINAESRISHQLNFRIFWEGDVPRIPLKEAHAFSSQKVEYCLLSYLGCLLEILMVVMLLLILLSWVQIIYYMAGKIAPIKS